MRELAAVALGGMIGSVTRYGVGLAFAKSSIGLGWPMATLFVNVLGCFAIGFAFPLIKHWQSLDTPTDLAVRVGFLGGFTTFSAFGFEVFRLWQEERMLAAFTVVLANVGLGLAAVAIGYSLCQRFVID